MSLAIDVDNIVQVLIGGTWYKVDHDSFTVDAFELFWERGMGRTPLASMGQGFMFESSGLQVSGPLSSIKAVKTE